MKMYVWSKPPAFLAVAQADSVDAARRRMLQEIGEGGDGSCPERDKARDIVANCNPAIWAGVNAEFALTDSAEVREQEAWSLSLSTAATSLRSQLAESQAREADAALDKAELSRIRPKRGDPYFHSTVEEWAAECRQTADLRAELATARKLCGEAKVILEAIDGISWSANIGMPHDFARMIVRLRTEEAKGAE